MGKNFNHASPATLHDFPKTTMRIFFSFIFLLSVFQVSGGGNWNRFRGINGEGRFPEINLPIEWQNKDHTWEISLPSTGHSSPVIWEGRIFTTCAAENDATQYVYPLIARQGKFYGKEIQSVRILITNSIVMHHPHRLLIRISFSFPGLPKTPMTYFASITRVN